MACYVSLFPDLWCNIGLSVSGLHKMRFNAYTLRRISTKKSVPKQTSIPIIRVDNFNLVSISFSVPWFIVSSVWVSAVYAKCVSTPIHSVFFSTKNQFPNKPGFPLSNLIILDSFGIPLFLCSLIYCVIGLSVGGLRKIRFNAYTLCQVSTINQFTREPWTPTVRVDNSSL